jgi:hypothetical protein
MYRTFKKYKAKKIREQNLLLLKVTDQKSRIQIWIR